MIPDRTAALQSERSVFSSALAGSVATDRRVLFQRETVLLAVCDVAILALAYLGTAVRIESYTFDLHIPDPQRMLVWCLVLAAIWLPVAVNLGAYERSVLRSSVANGYVTAKSVIIAGALFHIVPLVGGPVYSRVASMTVVLMLVVAMTVWRVLATRLVAQTRAPVDLVVLGAGWAGRALADALRQQPASGMRIVAFVETDPDRIGSRELNVPIFGLSDLPALMNRPTGPARLVLATPDEAHAAVYEQLTALAQSGIEILSMARVYEQVTGRVPVHHLGSSWWAMLPRPTSDVVYLGAKRAMDLVLGVLGLIVLAILLPVIALLRRFDSPGPLFFTQTRVGRYGQPLTMVKIRTLPVRPPATTYATYWERKRANQTSWLGSILRATGIDELPQCWSVLKGDMSIVGPRPYVPEEVEDFQRQIPFFRCRGLVKPGLTGWAQINWGYGLSLEDEIEKLQYDLYYVGHQCFYLDFVIILRTIAISVRRRLPLSSRQSGG